MKQKTQGNQALNNVLSEAVRVNGTYTSASDVRISGTIDGDVHVDGILYVGKKGVINGNIIANEIYVSGHVTGVLRSNGKITVQETAVIDGDIYTPSLVIEEHAVIEGLIHTSQNGRSTASNEVEEVEEAPEMEKEKQKEKETNMAC
jgi:cytoskeletal protein CcmA (bactofilin family)